MPVYVYKNLTTGATFELAQRITEDALSVDPTSGHPVKRLIQPVGIAFKGSGFYVTDSRKSTKSAPKVEGPKGDAPKGEASSGEASKGDAPKSDAPKSGTSDAPAPAAKPAAKAAAHTTAAGD